MPTRALQAINALIALLTVGLASVQIVFGARSPLYADANLPNLPILDSNLRFFGGMALGLGLAMLWITPRILRHAGAFRVIWTCALVGGLGRLVSVFIVGMPTVPLVVFTVIEVVGAPLMIVWHARLARAQRAVTP